MESSKRQHGPRRAAGPARCFWPPFRGGEPMPEINQTSAPKPKSSASPASNPPPKSAPDVTASAFELPRFDMPHFEIPKMEVPAAFREFAEKSVSQAKETYEKMKFAAEEATDVLEDTYASASKGAADYGLKLIETARTNTNAAFDFYTELFSTKSLSEVIELSTAHARKQFETVTAQTKELTALAQKVTTETTDPIKESVTKVFKKVA